MSIFPFDYRLFLFRLLLRQTIEAKIAVLESVFMLCVQISDNRCDTVGKWQNCHNIKLSQYQTISDSKRGQTRLVKAIKTLVINKIELFFPLLFLSNSTF